MNTKFKIVNTDDQGALSFHNDGWELWERPLDTSEEAEKVRQEWQARLNPLQGG